MKYIEKVLQPGEKICLLHAELGGLLSERPVVARRVAAARRGQPRSNRAPPGCGRRSPWQCSPPSRAVKAWFRRWTTEIDVTDRRVVYKRGFIRRHTIEINMDKVESVDVDQSLFGRLFDYGDIVIRGTGAGIEPLRGIDSPLAFRNAVTAR